jgi:hypothetical protein
MVAFMKRRLRAPFEMLSVITVPCSALILLFAPLGGLAEPTPAAVAAFDIYTKAVQARLDQQHRAQTSLPGVIALTAQSAVRLRGGDLIVEQVDAGTGGDLPGALLHHWRGSAFVARAGATDFEQLMESFNAYPEVFSPQVMEARMLSRDGDRFQVRMRVREQHVLTVVMDTDYNVTFTRIDARRGYSISRSTRFAEIESPGTASEHALSASQEHGFLWRQNTYWSYEERDGGLYLQIESVSLTRAIPHGLGWAVRPLIESVPRESLEFTLRCVGNALRKETTHSAVKTDLPTKKEKR